MLQQQPIEDQAVAIERLKQVIEAKVGRKIQTPKDFDYLSACITEELHEPISVSTLKRLWGYIQSSGSPRLSTLNMLAHFVGSEHWEAFCQSCQDEGVKPQDNPVTADLSTEADITPTTMPSNRHLSINKVWITVSCLIVLLVCGLLAWRYLGPQYGKEVEDTAVVQRHLSK